jgi:hypothetical protein
MSAPLGAFGGFLSRSFRDHDFHLGRYNCQWFLRQHFVLPLENGLIASGVLARDASVIERFRASNDPIYKRPNVSETWMPIIPLCGSAAQPVAKPERVPVSRDAVQLIAERSVKRIRVLAPRLLRKASWFCKALVIVGAWLLQCRLRSYLNDYLVKSLGDNGTLVVGT